MQVFIKKGYKMETTENAGHTHSIEKGDSYTGVTNNHRHKLSTGCSACDKTRQIVFVGKMMTSFNQGHAHFFDPNELK